MKIMHEESGNVYEIIEERGSFKLLDYNDSHSYTFKEAYEAIWATIEIIRNVSLDSITDEHLLQIVKRAHVTFPSSPGSVMASIKKEKIIRTYYDQIFLKILSQYRSGNETIRVSSKTSFNVDHEITSLIRKSLGVNLSIPDYKV